MQRSESSARLQAPGSAVGELAEVRGADRVVLDAAALERIRALQQPGRPDLLDKVITLYLDNSRSLTAQIRTALAARDAAGLCAAAHALKSSSANVGATALGDIARQLETLGRTASLEAAEPLVEQMLQEHLRVISALQAERAAE